MPKGRFAIDLTGQVFNRLTVLNKEPSYVSERGNTLARWKCQCSCGKIKTIHGIKLKSGATKSCGCLSKENWKINKLSGYEINKLKKGMAGLNVLFSVYRKNARYQGVSFDLDIEIFHKLTSSNCHYCNSSPSKKIIKKQGNGEYVYNGIDRVESKGGYLLDNVVPCCTICNFAKRNLSYEDFINHIEKIYVHTRKLRLGLQ